MEVTVPVALLISLATFLVTVGGTWFVTQRRIRDLETKVSAQDLKHDQIIIEINGLKIEINSLKIEIAKVQGSIAALNEKIAAMNEKFDLVIQGKIKNP
jgi:cell division protein FtsL